MLRLDATQKKDACLDFKFKKIRLKQAIFDKEFFSSRVKASKQTKNWSFFSLFFLRFLKNFARFSAFFKILNFQNIFK